MSSSLLRSAALCGTWLFVLAACEPGPTLVLGRLPDAASDADKDDDRNDEDDANDANAPPDENDAGDAQEEDAGVREPCESARDCESEARPYCSELLDRCVACLRDRHCGASEYCREGFGVCIEERD